MKQWGSNYRHFPINYLVHKYTFMTISLNLFAFV